ncbi:unnamed protein product [Chironomus riparius]|uniref:Large ribosomal subunit protein bL35m n=1 Tax=Chironomus riparius TaxID=315576 RepID=A0A9N9WUG4_9DIPT|nr:unnamed protein product [Chironomus riparius]
MFRALIPAISNVAGLARNQVKINTLNVLARNFSQFSIKPVNIQFPALNTACNTQILAQKSLIQPCQSTIVRNLTKFSLRKAKRKSVKAVIKRFLRLDWGIWIRTRAGRNKRIWRKSPAQKYRARQHVFCNATQSHMLDKMAGEYYKKPKYFVDDLYRPYHSRESYSKTARKPRDWDL